MSDELDDSSSDAQETVQAFADGLATLTELAYMAVGSAAGLQQKLLDQMHMPPAMALEISRNFLINLLESLRAPL